MNFAQPSAPPAPSGNFFRTDWLYKRLPAGDAMLAAGKGLSPAFFKLLIAIHAEHAVSFARLGVAFPRLEGDDLELWLAELCRMQLIAPALPMTGHAIGSEAASEMLDSLDFCSPTVPAKAVDSDAKPVRACAAPNSVDFCPVSVPARAANSGAKPIAACAAPNSLDFYPASVPAKAVAPSPKPIPASAVSSSLDVCLAPAPAKAPDSGATPVLRVMLVHKLPAARLAWWNLLAALPLEIIEAESLEEAEAALRQLAPQAVVLGAGNSNFAIHQLLNALQQPRAKQAVKVFLMLDEPAADAEHKAAESCADETVQAADWSSLSARMAVQLKLAAPASDPASPAPRLLCDLAPAPARTDLPPAAQAADAARDAPAQTTPAPDVPAPAAPVGQWKDWSHNALYATLVAIYAELDARAQEPAVKRAASPRAAVAATA
jgi:hypothetical protein